MITDYRPSDKGKKNVQNLKESIASVMDVFKNKMNDGREKELFMNKMEEACMIGTKAILSKDVHHTHRLDY